METEQTQAAAIVSTCTSLNLRKAARAASQFLESYLAPLGLHTGQFGILSHISKAGSVTMTHLAESLALDRTTLTRNLQLLQRDGLVEVVSGRDKRIREISLTCRGKEMLAQAVPLWREAEAALCERLGSQRQQTLLSHAAALINLTQSE
ncbi:MAG: MarR family winged helix-turn-helix transcriptional regulator [Janthinobacterium lividum]